MVSLSTILKGRYWLLGTRCEENSKDRYSRKVSIICRSGISRELPMFATKVDFANTCKSLCVLCASARKKVVNPLVHCAKSMFIP